MFNNTFRTNDSDPYGPPPLDKRVMNIRRSAVMQQSSCSDSSDDNLSCLKKKSQSRVQPKNRPPPSLASTDTNSDTPTDVATHSKSLKTGKPTQDVDSNKQVSEEMMKMRNQMATAIYGTIMSLGEKNMEVGLLDKEYEKFCGSKLGPDIKKAGFSAMFDFNDHPGALFYVKRGIGNKLFVHVKNLASSSANFLSEIIQEENREKQQKSSQRFPQNYANKPIKSDHPSGFSIQQIYSSDEESPDVQKSVPFAAKPQVNNESRVIKQVEIKSSSTESLTSNGEDRFDLKIEPKDESVQKNAVDVLCGIVETNSNIELSDLRVKFEEAIGCGRLGVKKIKELFGFVPKNFCCLVKSFECFKIFKSNGNLIVAMNDDYFSTGLGEEGF